MANQDRVNFVWAESALTTIPPIPVSEVAYRDTKQTPEQMEVGQQYDTIYNSARHNQLLFLLTSVAKTLCENGIMPFLAGQEYSQYARCIFTDGKLYIASRAILANEQPYPTPGDDSGVWTTEETSENLVPNSRRVIAGTGLTGGGPLSSDVTLSAKLDGKTTQAAADGAITVKDVAIRGNLEDLASARGQVGNAASVPPHDYSTGMLSDKAGLYSSAYLGSSNAPFIGPYSEIITGVPNYRASLLLSSGRSEIVRAAISSYINETARPNLFSGYNRLITEEQIGDGIISNNGILSVPEYEGATASVAGTSGLVPPATSGQQESFLTGGGEYKPALSTGGGVMTGSIQINDLENAIGAAPSTNTERGLFLGDKNSVVMGGFDVIQRASDNAKYTQMFAKNASGAFASIAAVMYEDGTREISTDCPMRLSDMKIESLFTDNLRLIKFSGAGGKEGLSMRYSPDSGELYLDGRAVHGKADTAVYANSAGSAATANRATGLTYTFTKESSLALPPGGTWFVLSWWDGDKNTAVGNWSGGQLVAGGSSVNVKNGAFALRIA